MTTKNSILLITGMHRSGTSLLGALVESMGVGLPGQLIKGDIYNIDGYYEREDIVRLQENLLIDMGRWWPTTYGCEPMPSGWQNTKIVRYYKDILSNLIQNEVASREEIWAIKDPRISLLLPIWQEIAHELGIELKIIASIRNPLEVINSLMFRDKESTGMTEERAEKLWYTHNSELVFGIGKSNNMLIDYSKWFDKEECGKQLEKLYFFCFGEQITDKTKEEARGKIMHKYRRSNINKNRIKNLVNNNTIEFYKKLVHEASRNFTKKRYYGIEKWLVYMTEKYEKEQIKDHWFHHKYYKNQVSANWNLLSLNMHYSLIGWRKTMSPNLLFNPNHYKHKAYLIGEQVNICPLDHFSKHGLEMHIEPNSITHYKWLEKSLIRVNMFKKAYLEGFHPWAAAAVAVNNGSQARGLKTLESWLKVGLKRKDLDRIINSDNKFYSQDMLSKDDKEEPLPEIFNISCDRCGIYNWQLYSWIELLYQEKSYTVDKSSQDILYILMGSYDEIESKLLIKLSTSRWVFCTKKGTIELLNRLGINAKLLDVGNIAEYTSHNHEYKAITSQYGFPDPLSMVKLSSTIVLGEVEKGRESSRHEPLSYMPNPNSINIERPKDARAIARWLVECYLLGIQLVWISNDVLDIKTEFWKTFQMRKSTNVKVSTPQLFLFPISGKEMMEEIAWRKQGYKKTVLMNPKDNKISEVIDVKGEKSADVTVCITLYNYKDRIINALESVRSQTLTNIDLIIVDDCSTDGGLTTVIDWLANNSSRFNRIKVVSHMKNLGLSTARNTGFKFSETEWIFVLDADNVILPLALESSLTIANGDNAKVGAIYTLIRAVTEENNQTNRSNKLMNFTYWNQIEFNIRNVIDAMALIKKSVWNKVGGYDNIIGGWEDYDFWCKLIENGYCGIICPQVLAEYYIHDDSMITTITSQASRRISRQLQEKHEWLNLPMANEHKIMMEES